MSHPLLRVVKMEGCGNDYVFLDTGLAAPGLDPGGLGPLEDLARRISDRHTGVGGDGLILLERGRRSPVAMRMWNADGSEGLLCLNGLRCAAKYAAEVLPELGERFTVETASGERPVRVIPGADGRIAEVEVEVGRPDFHRRSLPALGLGDELWGESFPGAPGAAAGAPPGSVGAPTAGVHSGIASVFPGYGVSVGNPHLVLWLDAALDVRRAPLESIAKPLALDPRFPEGVNVHLAAADTPDRIVTRPWERGTGMTLACGSGAVAVFAVARRLGRAGAEAAVEMPGGTVRLTERADGLLVLRGPAREVFRATWGG